jgi:hypothetical protein
VQFEIRTQNYSDQVWIDLWVKKNGATPVDAKSLNVSIIEAEQ